MNGRPFAPSEPSESKNRRPVALSEPSESKKRRPVVLSDASESKKRRPVALSEASESENRRPVALSEASDRKNESSKKKRIMLKDIPQVQSAPISSLKLTHFMGLMTFTADEVKKFFNQEGMTWPTKVQSQYLTFQDAYVRLDTAYQREKYSLVTPELKEADAACDRIYMGVKKVVDGWLHFELESETKQRALMLEQSMAKYGISVSEDYLGENNKLSQWLADVERNYQLEQAVKALGLTDTIKQLKEKVTLVRQLLTDRGLAQPAKGEMKAARAATEPEYRWLIAILNATALCDESEQKFADLFQTLNQNLNYLKNVVLARQGGAGEDGGDDDSDGGDDGSDSGSQDGSGSGSGSNGGSSTGDNSGSGGLDKD